MPIKRRPSELELVALSDQFRAIWRPGDVLRPWLRKHHTTIRDLVHGDWSWATLADALTRAGITYRTGRAWSPEGLRREVARASAPLRGSRRHGASRPPAPLSSHDTPDQPPILPAPPDAPARPAQPQLRPAVPRPQGPDATPTVATPPVPRFKAFSLKPQEPPRPLTPEEIEEREAMHHRMFGK